jgi:hypothetical protein
MLTGPISITTEATLIKTQLDTWLTQYGVTATIMANLRHLWESINQANGQPSVFICYTGEAARGGFAQANTLHRVDRQWTVVILRGHGFLTKSMKEIPVAPAFYDIVEACRWQLIKMTTVSEEYPIDYKAIRPMSNVGPSPAANVFLDAFQIEFSTANDIPTVSDI